MIAIILSDFHLGKGKFLSNGELNILEDFFEDDRFAEFLDYYSSGKHYWADVHLVLNGDILNLIQIDVDGVFTHIVDEDMTVRAIEMIANGHATFFQAIKRFLSAPNKKATYVIGNHDAAVAFNRAQQRLRDFAGSGLQFAFELNLMGIHIEHGHRFEAINTVPQHKLFMEGPNGKQILNLPWGSLFCIGVLPNLKKDRPYIDKVRPMSAYVKWCILHDLGFFFKMLWVVVMYLLRSNTDLYAKQNRNFKTTWAMLKQITIYPKYEHKARTILRKNRDIHTVVMGHTHVQEWRRFPEGKFYFNTGTWNTIPSMDAGLHENHAKLAYCLIEVNPKTRTLRGASLNIWQGKWRPFREEISTH
jgi:UDP-2,3-diacylglucosamine pyrophosphatase LpxH